MGNGNSRVVGCFAPFGNGKHTQQQAVDLDFLSPLDEGLGHSFCYVRPDILDSPAVTPSNSDRFMIDDSTAFETEMNTGSGSPSKQSFSETTFKTISGASVSANASTARTGITNLMFVSDAQNPAASFESTASFAAIPLQPIPRGSGHLNGFLSGPLERGFASGPLEKGGGGGFMSGPLDRGGGDSATDRINFSAPLAYDRRRVGLGRLMRSVSGPMRSAFSNTGWMHRLFQPMMQHSRDGRHCSEASRNCAESGPSENDYNEARHLQWAHGKAGEDRVHVVLSEEQGWLFVGIYDGFSGPDAPDFLMNNLYRAIDKELEGLLWDYEDKTELSRDCPRFSSNNLENDLDDGSAAFKANECENETHNEDKIGAHGTVDVEHVGESVEADKMVCVNMEDSNSNEDKIGAHSTVDVEHVGESVEADKVVCVNMEDSNNNECAVGDDCIEESCEHNGIISGVSKDNTSTKISGQGRRSLRLFELLQMELRDECVTDGSLCTSELGSNGIEELHLRGTLPADHLVSCSGSKEINADHIRDNNGAISDEFNDSNRKITSSFSALDHRQIMKGSLFKTRLRKIYRKQKSLRKKLFPWSYDWHREQTHVVDRVTETSVGIRRCKSGIVDHNAVLLAMARALQATENDYMEMVEGMLDRNPELSLMGSCVLVTLIKDQDVYVMNLGDSRVVLAQERPYGRHNNQNIAKDDLRLRSRSKELLARMELDRISEESPMHDPNRKIRTVNDNHEMPFPSLRVTSLQLSSDHCTGIEEEVTRIKKEHLDDAQAVFNDRVKGQLKVTRAFGAAFLKKPKFNDALLEMFRIDYVGTSPYVSCSPFVLHHRLCSNDRFLVLSSDGLYQYFSNEEVVSHVSWFMENMPEGDPAQYLIAELLFRAAKKNGMDFHELLDIPQGDRRKYHDDVSVMVISLEGRIWRSSG